MWRGEGGRGTLPAELFNRWNQAQKNVHKARKILLSTCCLLLEFLFQNQTHLFLQRWLYNVKINFVRNQHDTERTRGCSCRQLFHHSWGSSVRRNKQRSSVFGFLLCWCLAKLIFMQYDHLCRIRSCVCFAYFCWSGLLRILHSTASSFAVLCETRP